MKAQVDVRFIIEALDGTDLEEFRKTMQ